MAHPSTPDLAARLRSHLEVIVRERDPFFSTAGHFFVREYIRGELSQWGLVETHEFQWRNQTHQNLILKLASADTFSAQVVPIIIGAHYDAVAGSPGADDNGTGVVALLELAQRFALKPASRPIWLVAFDLEEYGLVGSRAYATDLKKQGQPIHLMMSLEMLGYCDPTPGSQRYPSILHWFYPNQGNFIALVGSVLMIPELRSLSAHMRATGVATEWLPAGLRGHVVPQTRQSDHASFWDQGYKALMVTDTAFLRNPHYHQRSDRIDTLDLDFLASVCTGLEWSIRNF